MAEILSLQNLLEAIVVEVGVCPLRSLCFVKIAPKFHIAVGRDLSVRKRRRRDQPREDVSEQC